VLSGRGLCDELIARPEESYRLCCVVVCDLETSKIGAQYIYDISDLRVNTLASCCLQMMNMTFIVAVAKGHLSSTASCYAKASFTLGQLVMASGSMYLVADQPDLLFLNLLCNVEGAFTLSNNIGVGIGGTKSTWALIDFFHTVTHMLKIPYYYIDIDVNVGWFAGNPPIICRPICVRDFKHMRLNYCRHKPTYSVTITYDLKCCFSCTLQLCLCSPK
jgi:hypothetical protein